MKRNLITREETKILKSSVADDIRRLRAKGKDDGTIAIIMGKPVSKIKDIV